MDADVLSYLPKFMPKTYANQAIGARLHNNKLFSELIKKKKCPDKGWKDSSIELLLHELSLLDSNNFPFNAGVGEREARIYSDLVARRHYSFGHGIGRSGDITEIQPKAAGSSLIYKLTNSMMLHMIKRSGIRNCTACVIVPMATGMSLVLCLMTIRKERPEAKYVLWPRIDQKSCFKSILAAGFEPVIIENLLVGDELRTDVKDIENKIKQIGAEHIAAVLSTTSCFAPRGIDHIEEIAKLCKDNGIPHIINNAYGIQAFKCSHCIQKAAQVGRVDAFVQSTDKNFMVPVGGSVIAGFDMTFIDALTKTYPGRASGSPILDVFITLLKMGTEGYKNLLEKRRANKGYLESELLNVAGSYGLRVLKTPNNPISIAMTLPKDWSNLTRLGSMLFVRGVSGTRVLDGSEEKNIDGHIFKGWGTHCNEYPSPYMTAAATIGMTKDDVNLFIKRLRKCLAKFKPIPESPYKIGMEITSQSIIDGEPPPSEAADVSLYGENDDDATSRLTEDQVDDDATSRLMKEDQVDNGATFRPTGDQVDDDATSRLVEDQVDDGECTSREDKEEEEEGYVVVNDEKEVSSLQESTSSEDEIENCRQQQMKSKTSEEDVE